MSDKYLIVERSSPINAVIHDIFQTTQRIKFTAFDVSARFIIFGASSGGIYIFHRESCQFFKLIPSSYGAATLLSTSKDEKFLAVAVATGSVVIFEDCFSDIEIHPQVFNEHDGSTVTAIKWNCDELYCGDSTGRVTTISVNNFLVIDAGVQTPAACLMQLDSPVIQLDTHVNSLLVSTQTRSLLCDTNTERYRQIGKKPRAGSFGSCFFDKEGGAVKIYCARPGARLWQADTHANVALTLDFRPSLEQAPNDIVFWEEGPDATLKILPQSRKMNDFNFGKLFQFLEKFVMTFSEDGFYIFEPSSSVLLCRTNHIGNIKDVRSVNSSLYVWHGDSEMSVLTLLTVEELIVRSLLLKQYNFCGEVCMKFYQDVMGMLDKSKRMYLISVLESKVNDTKLLKELAPIFSRLRENSEKLKLQRLDNGIVRVDNGLTAEKNQPKVEKSPYHVFLEQYRINKIHKNVQTANFTQLMKSCTNKELYDLIVKLQHQLQEESSDWCREVFLKNLNFSENLPYEMLTSASEAFLLLNDTRQFACECNFPLPEAHRSVPRFYETGCRLMQQLSNPQNFLNVVPYMNKFILQNILTPAEVETNAALIIQFSDASILDALTNKMTYDVWDRAVKLLNSLRRGCCLNCGKNITTVGALDWDTFGKAMVHSIKGSNAIKLLSSHQYLLPQNALNRSFYQYCMFFTITEIESDKFRRILTDEDVMKQLEKGLEKFLRQKYVSGTNYTTREPDLNCDYCELPLKIPIIDELVQLQCGHLYHKVCLLFIKNKCLLCDKTESI